MGNVGNVEPYRTFGETCWRGPLGDVRLSDRNEFNIEDNGTYGTAEDVLVMIQCMLDAYKMYLTTPPSDRPKS